VIKRHTSTHRIVCWQITSRCNRACPHCISGSSLTAKHPDRNIQASIERLVSLGISKISYSGGEPLLYPYISTMLETASRYNIDQVVTTNGDILDLYIPEWFQYLQYIKFSFYGHSETHDAIMGRNCYNSLINHVYNLSKNGISVGANYVVSAKSFDDIINFLEDAKNNGIKQVLLIIYVPIGKDLIDDAMEIKNISDYISIICNKCGKYARNFQGGIKIHLYNKNHFSLFLDSDDNFILPKNYGKKPFVMGGLFDDNLLLDSGKLVTAEQAINHYINIRYSTPNIIPIGESL
jgi:MoaA/NifB/PqqE/SkfB family radical SAM enzyme